jgi:hypothetical protein
MLIQAGKDDMIYLVNSRKMLSSPPTEETNLVPLELLKGYLDIGFILIPLFQNSVYLNIDGLVTDAEWESLPDGWIHSKSHLKNVFEPL